MTRKKMLLVLLLLSITFTSGCLGAREIDDLAMVMAVGLDKGSKPGTIRVTAQIARPADVRGQTGAPTAGSGDPIWTVSGEGDSIFEAIRSIARFSSRRVFWAHNQIIVIGEELAREGISDIIDFFSRNHELRMRTWVVVAPGEAKKIVTLKTGLEVIPGVSMNKVFRYSQIVSEAPRTDMRTLSAAFVSQSTQPILARVDTRDRVVSSKNPGEFGSTPQVELSGTAVFKRDKMAGWLNMNESRGLLWFVEPVESRVVVTPCPNDSLKSASLELKHNSFSVTPHYQNGDISFHLKLNANLDLVEVGCGTIDDNQKLMSSLEITAKEKLTQELRDVLHAAQQTYQLDFLELGKTFQNRYPAEWKQVSGKWGQLFPKAKINIQVDAQLKSPVLLRKPYTPGK